MFSNPSKLFPLLYFFVAALLVVSCNKESATVADETITENFTSETVYAIQRDGNCGKFGCYEFVFPITINFPDGSSAEVGDYENLKSSIRDWKTNNPDVEDRPELGFPVEVVSEEGEITTISDREELQTLRQECRRSYYQNHDHRRHRGKGDRCFKLVFPLTLNFPDASSLEVEDRNALKTAVRDWKANNPDAEERPELGFPITVTLEDETTQTVNSQDELKALKESCSEE